MKWILIVAFIKGGAVTVEVPSKDACIKAMQFYDKGYYLAKPTCLHNGTGEVIKP